jgi:hypothetical protein
MIRRVRFVTLLAAAACASFVIAACARVQPWQRELHGKRVMNPDPDAAERKLDAHVQEYREGSIGGTGVGGGGCGCN